MSDHNYEVLLTNSTQKRWIFYGCQKIVKDYVNLPSRDGAYMIAYMGIVSQHK
jgi:hypothetical protein